MAGGSIPLTGFALNQGTISSVAVGSPNEGVESENVKVLKATTGMSGSTGSKYHSK